MSPIVVLGDELAGAGFRLAGVDVRHPAGQDMADEFAQALTHAALIVLTPDSARALEPKVLREAMLAESPLVVVMPELTEPRTDEAFARRMRAALGIEA